MRDVGTFRYAGASAGHRRGTGGGASPEGSEPPVATQTRSAWWGAGTGSWEPRGSSARGEAVVGTPPAPRPAPAHWRPRRGAGRGRGRSDPRGPTTRHTGSPCSMLRAAALAAAGLGPRLGRRLLSAAAAHAVPAPNPQPEVFYNKVRQPAGPCPSGALFSSGYGACWVGRPQASVYPVGIGGICRSWSLRTPSLPFLRAFWPLSRLSLTARIPLCSWDFVRLLIFLRTPPPVLQRHLLGVAFSPPLLPAP